MITILFAFLFAQPHAHMPPPCPAPVAATQSLVTVRGRVVDQSGAPIPQAIVRLQVSAGAPSKYAKTDNGGCYQLAATPGSYLLQVQAQGFFTSKNNVIVADKTDNTFDVALKVRSGGGPVVTQESSDPAVSGAIPWVRFCFADPQGMPTDPVQFKLESATAPTKAYTGEYFDNWQMQPAWGCGLIRNLSPGEYRLSAVSPGFQHLEQTVAVVTKVSCTMSFTLSPERH